MTTNIYPAIVHDLHSKVRKFIDNLNLEGQIDLDSQGYPFVVNIVPLSGSFQVKIIRNSQYESFTLNPRKRTAKPIMTWNPDDGYVRPTPNKSKISIDDPEKKSTERKRRPAFEAFEHLVNGILEN
jgi:hypothetical protein